MALTKEEAVEVILQGKAWLKCPACDEDGLPHPEPKTVNGIAGSVLTMRRCSLCEYGYTLRPEYRQACEALGRPIPQRDNPFSFELPTTPGRTLQAGEAVQMVYLNGRWVAMAAGGAGGGEVPDSLKKHLPSHPHQGDYTTVVTAPPGQGGSGPSVQVMMPRGEFAVQIDERIETLRFDPRGTVTITGFQAPVDPNAPVLPSVHLVKTGGGELVLGRETRDEPSDDHLMSQSLPSWALTHEDPEK
jgi:hypothetical protein